MLLVLLQLSYRKCLQLSSYESRSCVLTMKWFQLIVRQYEFKPKTDLGFKVSIYLVFLAIADLGYLVTCWYDPLNYGTECDGDGEDEPNRITRMNMVNFFRGASDFVVIFMAFDRLRTISKVMKWKPTHSEFGGEGGNKENIVLAIVHVIFAYIISLCFHIPLFLDVSSDNGACHFYARSSYNESEEEKSSKWNWETERNCSIYLWLYVLAMKMIPPLLVAMFNIVIAWKLKLIWHQRRNFRRKIVEAKSTLMMQNTQIDHDREPVTIQLPETDEIQLATDTLESNFSSFRIHEMNLRYEEHLKKKELDMNKGMRKTLNVSRLFGRNTKMIHRNNEKIFINKVNERKLKETNKIINYSLLSILIAILFVLCNAPSNIPLVSYPLYHHPFEWFNCNYGIFTNLLQEINYAFNFFLSCIWNSEIRKEAKYGITFGIRKFREMVRGCKL